MGGVGCGGGGGMGDSPGRGRYSPGRVGGARPAARLRILPLGSPLWEGCGREVITLRPPSDQFGIDARDFAACSPGPHGVSSSFPGLGWIDYVSMGLSVLLPWASPFVSFPFLFLITPGSNSRLWGRHATAVPQSLEEGRVGMVALGCINAGSVVRCRALEVLARVQG